MAKKQIILVTGGAGFIGSHLCKRLLNSDYKVVLTDTLKASKHASWKKNNIASFENHQQLTLIDASVIDYHAVTTLINKYHVDTIIHLAAQADVASSIKDPSETIRRNLISAITVFEAAVKERVKNILYASSALVYGKNANIPMKEDDPCTIPTSPYAASMRAVEIYAYSFYKQYKIPITGLRFFPVYGPGMRDNLIIPVLIKQIRKGMPITIYGNGKTARSYTYIDDIINGIIKAVTRPSAYELINLGSPTPVTILELISTIENILGKKAKREFTSQRREEIPLMYPYIKKAKKLLSFSPTISLEEGIRRYYENLEASRQSR